MMNKNLNLAAVALGMASVWMMVNPANASTIIVTHTEVSVGLNHIIGFGPNVFTDSTSLTSDGRQPAIALLGGYTEGNYPPGDFNTIGVNSRASASIAYDTTFGNPSLYGTSSASIAFERVTNRGTGIAHAPANENYVFYEFEVLDGRVDYSISFDNDVTGFLNLKTLAGNTVLNMGAGQTFQSFLDPGTYTLDTFLTLSVGSNEGSGSGNNSFAITFMDSTLNVNPVPLPAAAWLFISALGGLIVAKRKQLIA